MSEGLPDPLGFREPPRGNGSARTDGIFMSAAASKTQFSQKPPLTVALERRTKHVTVIMLTRNDNIFRL